MEKHVFEGKEIEEIKKQIEDTLQVEENDYYMTIDESKTGFLKGKKLVVEVITKKEVLDFIKKYLQTIAKYMELEFRVETKVRENQIYVNLFTNNNALLIGKNGRTIEALQTLLKQTLFVKTGHAISVVADVENYKNKKLKNIEFLAKKTAKEVARTKMEAQLTEMNSYERRIVHTTLADWKDVYTESAGEEPNRYVVIKPKDTK